MPKETLSSLERDAERLLFAGAQVARGDGDLDARRQKLATFAAKAPAIAKVVEQVEKTQKASGKNAAAEVLNLAALMAQVRGAQAAPAAPAGDLTDLPPAEPVESPLSPTELLSLVKALTESGKGRPRIISDAVERGAVRDLRLLPFCVRAIGDPAVGHVVAEELLPSLGHLVVPELRATLRIEKGRETDARKLSVLAAIQKQDAKPLLVEAAEKGSPEVRRQAIEELATLDAAAVEPIALRALAEDRSAEVKKAAVRALAPATSDAALDALFAAFTSGRDLRHVAADSLSRFNHPRATERVLSLLTPELLTLANLKLPKADTPAKKKANEKAEREHGEKVAFLSAVLDLLAARKDRPDTVERVLGVFHDHKVKDVKNAAARALLKSGYDKAFDELASAVYDADWDTRDEFVEGILAREPDRAFERLGRFLDPATFKSKNHVSFAEHILDTLDGHSDHEEPDENAEEKDDEPEARTPSFLKKEPRWIDAAIALLNHKDLQGSALDVLAKVKSDKARDAVIAFAATYKKEDQSWRILQALKAHKDARVPPLMLAILDRVSGSWARRYVFNVLREYDDAALVPALQAWGARKKRLEKHEKEELEGLIQFLQRDRTLTAGV